MLGVGGRPKAPVAEGGPVVFDGENRRDWFPGVRGMRAAPCAQLYHIKNAIFNKTKPISINFRIMNRRQNRFDTIWKKV